MSEFLRNNRTVVRRPVKKKKGFQNRPLSERHETQAQDSVDSRSEPEVRAITVNPDERFENSDEGSFGDWSSQGSGLSEGSLGSFPDDESDSSWEHVEHPRHSVAEENAYQENRMAQRDPYKTAAVGGGIGLLGAGVAGALAPLIRKKKKREDQND